MVELVEVFFSSSSSFLSRFWVSFFLRVDLLGLDFLTSTSFSPSLYSRLNSSSFFSGLGVSFFGGGPPENIPGLKFNLEARPDTREIVTFPSGGLLSSCSVFFISSSFFFLSCSSFSFFFLISSSSFFFFSSSSFLFFSSSSFFFLCSSCSCFFFCSSSSFFFFSSSSFFFFSSSSFFFLSSSCFFFSISLFFSLREVEVEELDFGGEVVVEVVEVVELDLGVEVGVPVEELDLVEGLESILEVVVEELSSSFFKLLAGTKPLFPSLLTTIHQDLLLGSSKVRISPVLMVN